ncbi:MAG: hypothetical protein K8W52_10640 [Deltaproteobacteria bacterium]|nr:hypothetical protein [Deltaproteobacteria bacterium]
MRRIVIIALAVHAAGCAVAVRGHIGVARVAGETTVTGGISLGGGVALPSGGAVIASGGLSHGVEAAADVVYLAPTARIGVRGGAAVGLDFLTEDSTRSVRVAPLLRVSRPGHPERTAAIGIEAALLQRRHDHSDGPPPSLGGSVELSVELYRFPSSLPR